MLLMLPMLLLLPMHDACCPTAARCCLLHAACYPVYDANCIIPTTRCRIPDACCLLGGTHCLMCDACCLLTVADYPMPVQPTTHQKAKNIPNHIFEILTQANHIPNHILGRRGADPKPHGLGCDCGSVVMLLRMPVHGAAADAAEAVDAAATADATDADEAADAADAADAAAAADADA